MPSRVALLVPALVLGLVALTGCGGDDEPTSTPPAATSAAQPPPGTPGEVPAVSGKSGAEPTIATPAGTPPDRLLSRDVVVGSGEAVAAGDTLTFHYKGVDWDTGEVFDSSWARNEPLTYALAELIPGWQTGIPGMKAGGRRELVIPPDLAYGPPGSGHPLAGKTLVFVIDVLEVG